MKRNRIYSIIMMLIPVVLLNLVSLIAAQSGTKITAVQKKQKPAAVVKVVDLLKFMPARVTIKVGQTVEWKNTSVLVHTVTADPKLAVNKEHVRLPKGAKPFNSGNIAPDATFSHKFTVPGLYRYFCIPHEATGMVGEVLVKP